MPIRSLLRRQQSGRPKQRNSLTRPRQGQSRNNPFSQLPYLSYDPSYAIESRAIDRGVRDQAQDTRRNRHRLNQDTRQTVRDLRQDLQRGTQDYAIQQQRGMQDYGLNYSRGMQDYGIDLERGLTDIGYSREDAQTRYGRGRQSVLDQMEDLRTQGKRGEEDYQFAVGGLDRKYKQLGEEQFQGANAAGVLGGTTTAAAAARRADNRGFEQQPLDTERGRLQEDVGTGLGRAGTQLGYLGEDLQTALGRLGTSEQQLRQDYGLATGRLGEDTAINTGRLTQDTSMGTTRLRQDVRHDTRLTRQDRRRGTQDLRRSLNRNRREGVIGRQDLFDQALFDALQRNPGRFSTLRNQARNRNPRKR